MTIKLLPRTALLVLLLSGLSLQGCASGSPQAAVSWGDAVQVRRALQNGAAVDEATADGWTRLLTATRAGNADVVSVLVQFGADMQARNRHGWSALLIASRYGYPDIVRFLIEEGAYVHTKNHADYTPLMLAALGGHQEIIEALVASGVRLDVMNDDGRTAVYYAALNANEDVVRYLLGEGLEVQVMEADGEELFATAIALKVRATLHSDNGEAGAAERDFLSAADFFERAEVGLIAMADDTADNIRKGQIGSVFASLLGIVAAAVDTKNLRSGNPTRYSEGFSQADLADLSPLQIQEAYYRSLAQEASTQVQECLAMSGGER